MFTGSVKFQKQAQGFSISKQHFFTRIHPIPSWLLYSCLHARDSGYTLPQDASFPSLSIPISDWIFGVAQINSSLLTISVTAILLPGMCCPLFLMRLCILLRLSFFAGPRRLSYTVGFHLSGLGNQGNLIGWSVVSITELESILQMSHGVSNRIVDLISELEHSCYVQVAIIILCCELFPTIATPKPGSNHGRIKVYISYLVFQLWYVLRSFFKARQLVISFT